MVILCEGLAISEVQDSQSVFAFRAKLCLRRVRDEVFERTNVYNSVQDSLLRRAEYRISVGFPSVVQDSRDA